MMNVAVMSVLRALCLAILWQGGALQVASADTIRDDLQNPLGKYIFWHPYSNIANELTGSLRVEGMRLVFRRGFDLGFEHEEGKIYKILSIGGGNRNRANDLCGGESPDFVQINLDVSEEPIIATISFYRRSAGGVARFDDSNACVSLGYVPSKDNRK